MPFDFDRIIDHQLYLATQQCIQPHVQQQRRVSSAPAATTTAAAAGGPPRIAGARKSSLGSLISPWTTSSGGSNSSSGGGRKYSSLYHHHRPRPSAQQGYSPVDLFFTAPVGVLARGGRELHGGGGGRTPAHPLREGSSSSLDQFVTAPVGDFTTSPAVDVPLPPQRRHGNGSRPGSSDTDDWTFETASGGSASGSCSGLETTVDLTPSPPPSRQQQPGKLATYTSAAAASQPHAPEPPLPNQQRVNGVAAVTLQVQDLQRAKRFYECVFGVPCLPPGEDGTSAVLSLDGGALVVTLRESPPPDRRRGDDVAPRAVPLTVPVDDVGVVCRRLRGLAEEGERVGGPWYAEPVAGLGPARVVEFHDPAGNFWRVGKVIGGS